MKKLFTSIIPIKISGKEFVGIELPEGMTVDDFKKELMLIKGVYGNSSSHASKRLDEYYKEHKSCMGLK